MFTVCDLFLPQDPEALKKTQGVGPIRKVLLSKEDHEGLGISITVSPGAKSAYKILPNLSHTSFQCSVR